MRRELKRTISDKELERAHFYAQQIQQWPSMQVPVE